LNAAALARHFGTWRTRLTPSGGLWIAWPKKPPGYPPTSARPPSARTAGLSAGLVDNKIAAVDETWSALRFVIRLADRPGG
jgi:hypothetical protein